jgi:formylglycine-generating enzyme required for sulfatase activity
MKYEVTVADFKKFVDETSYKTEAETGDGCYTLRGKNWIKSAKVNWRCAPDGDIRDPKEYNHPVIFVSWNDALAYADWMSKKTGKTWRLPTEAEWEYAAKAGQNLKYAGTDNLDMSGWYSGNSKRRTHPVGLKLPNFLGLYDMTGNVWEWCSDYYAEDYYKNSQAKNPTGAKTGTSRVIRGGSWLFDSPNCRISKRSDAPQDSRNNNIGFRLVVVL